jgi:hypothetical protein
MKHKQIWDQARKHSSLLSVPTHKHHHLGIHANSSHCDLRSTFEGEHELWPTVDEVTVLCACNFTSWLEKPPTSINQWENLNRHHLVWVGQHWTNVSTPFWVARRLLCHD